jgi:hypothetical protein
LTKQADYLYIKIGGYVPLSFEEKVKIIDERQKRGDLTMNEYTVTIAFDGEVQKCNH